jgi:hypothetical protein
VCALERADLMPARYSRRADMGHLPTSTRVDNGSLRVWGLIPAIVRIHVSVWRLRHQLEVVNAAASELWL